MDGWALWSREARKRAGARLAVLGAGSARRLLYWGGGQARAGGAQGRSGGARPLGESPALRGVARAELDEWVALSSRLCSGGSRGPQPQCAARPGVGARGEGTGAGGWWRVCFGEG